MRDLWTASDLAEGREVVLASGSATMKVHYLDVRTVQGLEARSVIGMGWG